MVPALVVVAPTFGHPGKQREDRLGAIECLHLCLLVDTEDNGVVRRAHVKPDDVAHLVDEGRVR